MDMDLLGLRRNHKSEADIADRDRGAVVPSELFRFGPDGVYNGLKDLGFVPVTERNDTGYQCKAAVCR